MMHSPVTSKFGVATAQVIQEVAVLSKHISHDVWQVVPQLFVLILNFWGLLQDLTQYLVTISVKNPVWQVIQSVGPGPLQLAQVGWQAKQRVPKSRRSGAHVTQASSPGPEHVPHVA